MPHARASIAAALSLFALAGCEGASATPPEDAGASSSASTSSTGTGGHGGHGGSGTGGVGGAGGGGLACAGSGISKGPWSLAITETSVKIRWEACKEGTEADVTLVPEGGGAPVTVSAVATATTLTDTHPAAFDPTIPPDLAGTYYTHEAAIDGLTPSTCYTYELSADAARHGRVCTARMPGEPFRFMAIGDTNPGLGSYTVDLLAKVLPENPDFVVHGGDVQYYASGLETWASWFPLMQPMLSQGGFFPALGNHEVEMPDELDGYYRRFFGGAGFDGADDYYRFTSGGVWFFALNTEIDEETGPQADWLEAQLADAAASPGYRFSVVYLHKPWVTCGDKSQDTAALAHFEPLFLQHNVPVVLQAHMHGYERFDINGITYITTGGGGGALEDVDKNIDRPECALRVASGAFRHAVMFDVAQGALSGRAVDETGVVRDSFSLAVP